MSSPIPSHPCHGVYIESCTNMDGIYMYILRWCTLLGRFGAGTNSIEWHTLACAALLKIVGKR